MRKLKISSIFIIFAGSVLIHLNSYSKEITYVYCVNKNKDWHWLVDSKNEYIWVNGTWGNHLVDRTSRFKYFILDNAEQNMSVLIEQCKKAFGTEYNIPQPANKKWDSWNLFAVKSGVFYNGVVDIFSSSIYGRAIKVKSVFYFDFVKEPCKY